MSFNDAKGQEIASRCLKSAIKNNKIAHAYIFAGPPDSGRLLLAKNFAKALNCADPENFPCDRCASCVKIDKNLHPDVKSLTYGGRGGDIIIEQIRGLISDIILKPYEGRYKVFIIEDAHLLNAAAANSFLKTLEEPPANSVLILITERPSDLAPTIASRCQIVRLKPAGACADTPAARDAALARFADEKSVENLTSDDREGIVEDLSILASWYRDILVYKITGDRELVANIDRLDDIRDEGKRSEAEEILMAFENILKAQNDIENNINPKLALGLILK